MLGILYYKYLIYTTHSILEPLQKVGSKSCILQGSKLSFSKLVCTCVCAHVCVHVCVCTCVCVRAHMHVFSRVRLFVTPWTVAYLASLSMGFSWQEYWNRFPLSSPGDLPNLGIEPTLQADSLLLSYQAFPKRYLITVMMMIMGMTTLEDTNPVFYVTALDWLFFCLPNNSIHFADEEVQRG